MWWQLFFVLVATAAASEDDSGEESPDCEILTRRECVSEGRRPLAENFPSNEEELEDVCNYTVKLFECSHRVFSNCKGEDTFYGRYLAEMEANFRRICNEDAVLRTAVVDNLSCLKANLTKIEMCYGFSRDRNSFSVAMKNIIFPDVEEVTYVEEDDPSSTCLHSVFHFGCSAATAGELCGNAARDVFLNVLQGFNTFFELCPPGTKEKLPEIVRVLKMENEKVKSVENT